jgi:hypothetical protein
MERDAGSHSVDRIVRVILILAVLHGLLAILLG